MKDTLTLSIGGMHCGACVRRVTDALRSVPGVQLDSVQVGSAQMAYSPEKATAEDITAAVNRIGFQAHIEK
ncbi:MAG TPA: heavy metal-associated domain-containing protein [Acidobacteriaceae bacterium]|jgi:copper chaperone CopZ